MKPRLTNVESQRNKQRAARVFLVSSVRGHDLPGVQPRSVWVQSSKGDGGVQAVEKGLVSYLTNLSHWLVCLQIVFRAASH